MLTLPLSFRAVFDALYHNESWSDYWSTNMYTIAIYNALLFFFGSYVPMLMQIFSLVFGFVRHKQVKVFRPIQDSSKGSHR